jgi:hypothetical protein
LTRKNQEGEADAMLSMRHIQKIYRTDLIETHALHDVSVEV